MIVDKARIEEIKMLCKEIGDYPHLDVDPTQLSVLEQLLNQYLTELNEMEMEASWNNRPTPYTD